MIPYLEWRVIDLGPVHIQVWGLFVAAGILAAVAVGAREARRTGLESGRFIDLASTTLVAAFVCARLVHALFYDPQTYLADPLRIFRVWEGGMSMTGGILGGMVGAWYGAAKARLDLRAYAGLMAFALPLGCGIGRIGCFLIHDHPGTLRSGGFLTVRYPDGDRYDHGLLLSLLGFLTFGAFLALRSKAAGRFPNYLALYLLAEGGTRFALDFFRAWDIEVADARYLGLTPAQYVAVLLVAAGGKMLYTGGLWVSSSNATKIS